MDFYKTSGAIIMGLETFVINGETLTFFNIAEEMSFLRDVLFSFLAEYSTGFLAVIGVLWLGVFIMAVIIAMKKQMMVIS